MAKRMTAAVQLESMIRGLLQQVEDAHANKGLVSSGVKMSRNVPANRPSPAVRQLHTFTFEFKGGRTLQVSIAELEPAVGDPEAN